MRKLSISLIIVVITSTIFLGWAVNTFYNHLTKSQDQAHEYEYYLHATSALTKTLNTVDNAEIFIDHWNTVNALKLQLLERENLPLPKDLQITLSEGKPIILESLKGVEAYYLLKPTNKIIAYSLPENPKTNKRSTLEFLLTLTFYGGITLIVLIWVWPLIVNLGYLRAAAVKFGSGDLSTRVSRQKISYIRDIESEFNNMADRIEALIADNKLLSRAVSHDLKTPLARLRFGLDALTETEKPELKEKYAHRVNRDLEEMESLIDTLLQFARLEEARIELKNQEIQLKSLFSQHVSTFEQYSINIDISNIDDSAKIIGDVRYFSMLIHNLMSNAINHAKNHISVSWLQEKSAGYLIFEDDGVGIDESDRENMFKPFWRSSQARNQKGHGMGLAIVARIAEWHAIEIKVDHSQDLGGAKITLIFAL